MRTQLHLDEARLPDYLRRIGVFEPFETIRVEKAGDGNINWVRRASSPEGKSFVIKQARPALERFPEYQAPTERIVFEARYYEHVRRYDLGSVCPAIHCFEPDDRVLVLEDLGGVPRLDEALAAGPVDRSVVKALAAFLGRVHRGTRGEDLAPRFRNEAMQRLHGDHIFDLPLAPNDFPLPPRTRERAEALWTDAALRETAARAYARYLKPEGALVHGDVQAGNVLLTAAGPKLLDAEIAHVGDPAFDLGTLLAHLALPGVAAGRPEQGQPALDAAWRAYANAHGAAQLAAIPSVVRYAGLEMLRRTIGAARVAAVAEDEAGLRVVDRAVTWIQTPPDELRALFV